MEDNDIDAALTAVRNEIVAQFGDNLSVHVDNVLAVIAVNANDARRAIGWRRVYGDKQDARSRSYAALYFGRVEAQVETLRVLGLPVPALTGVDILGVAEKLLSDVSTAELLGDEFPG